MGEFEQTQWRNPGERCLRRRNTNWISTRWGGGRGRRVDENCEDLISVLILTLLCNTVRTKGWTKTKYNL